MTPHNSFNLKLSLLATSLLAAGVAANPIASNDTAQTLVKTIVENGANNALNKSTKNVSKVNIELKDLGRSVTILDDDILVERGVEDIRKAFDYVAGFNIAGPGQQSFISRGVSSNLSNIMVDGLRSLHGQKNGGGSVAPSTFNVEEVVFLKGPEGLLYGSGITGGMVNVVTKMPEKEASTQVSLKNKTWLAGDVGYFSRNNTSFYLDSTGQLGQEDLLYRSIIQYTPTGEYFQKGRSIDEKLVDISLVSTHIKDTRLTAKYESLDRFKTGGTGEVDGVFDESYFTGSITEFGKPVNRDAYYGSHLDKGSNKVSSFLFIAETQLDDEWELTAKYKQGKSKSRAMDLRIDDDINLITNDQGEEVPNIGAEWVERLWTATSGDQKYKLLDVTLDGKMSIASMEHQLFIGANYRDMNAKYRASSQDEDLAKGANQINAADPSQQTIGAIPSDLLVESRDPLKTKDLNIFVRDNIALSDSFNLVLGLAYVNQKREETRTQRDDSVDVYSKSFSDTIWDLGAVYALNDAHNLFATYSRSYDPISARTISLYGIDGYNYKAIEGKNLELGIKSQWLDDSLTSSITLYQLDKSNSYEYERQPAGSDKKYHLIQLNGHSFRSKGVELDISYQVSDRLSSTMSYAYTDAAPTQGTSTGIQASGTPKHAIALWNNYQLNDEINLNLGVRHETVRTVGGGSDFTKGMTLPAYTEIDMGASYVTGPWKTSASLRNLFDANHAQAGMRYVDIQPSEPRSLDVSVTYTF